MQIFISALIISLNLIFYSQRYIYNKVQEIKNSMNESKLNCVIDESYNRAYYIFKWIDLVNSSLLPFFLMFFNSIFLSYCIFRARKRVIIGKVTFVAANTEKRKLKRDIRFTITLISLNIVFIALNFPINICLLSDCSNLFFSITDTLYYCTYVVNFFIYFMANSIFRKEFLLMFHLSCK
jgi:hypothetical protein